MMTAVIAVSGTYSLRFNCAAALLKTYENLAHFRNMVYPLISVTQYTLKILRDK